MVKFNKKTKEVIYMKVAVVGSRSATDNHYPIIFEIFDEEGTHHLNNHKGIYIDIIPFDNAKKSDSIKQKIQAVLVRNITDTMFYKNKIRKLKETKHPILVILLSILSKYNLMKLQKKISKMNKNNNSEYVVALAGSYQYQKETMKRDILLPPHKIKFEQKEYYGMNDPDAYLTKIFGNYMELPPVEKRSNHMPLKIEFEQKDNKL